MGDFQGHPFRGNQYTEGAGTFPHAGGTVGGLVVRGGPVPNMSSIEGDAEVLKGVRVVKMSALPDPSARGNYYAADDFRRIEALAAAIRASGEITPLIVQVDKDGPYVLEGGHRMAALHALGVTEFPAIVALEEDAVVEDGTAPDWTPPRQVGGRS